MRKIIGLILTFSIIMACSSESVQELADPCDTADVSYQSEVEMILTKNCATSGCHLGEFGPGGLDLSTFEDAKAIAADGQLVGRITGNSGNLMPPDGPLPECEIRKIRAWVEDGALNN